MSAVVPIQSAPRKIEAVVSNVRVVMPGSTLDSVKYTHDPWYVFHVRAVPTEEQREWLEALGFTLGAIYYDDGRYDAEVDRYVDQQLHMVVKI